MTPATHRLLLFGHPVAHSLSPVIQQAFAAQCGITLQYAVCEVPAAGLEAAARAFFAGGGYGANVTVPHKRAALALAAAADEAARRAGVANLLYRDADGRLRADNTDGSGLLADLRERRGLRLAGMRVLVIGAGGAAHGVAGPLLDAGIATLVIANRTRARAVALAEASGARARACALDALAEQAPFDLVLNATSAGHGGKAPVLPAALVHAGTVCGDLSYGQAARPFLAWARQAGAAEAFDGLGMLVETAAASFERWFGQRPASAAVFEQIRQAATPRDPSRRPAMRPDSDP